MFNPDRIHLAKTTRPAQAAMAVITKLQDYKSEEQALGLALAFVKMCERFNVRPISVIEAAARMFSSESPTSIELRALAQYIEKEIKG